jgi:tRNA G37 N-methylase Trm5
MAKAWMKVLAGDDDTVTEVKQQECRFQLDIRQVNHTIIRVVSQLRCDGACMLQVYWNSRLDTEHRRLVSLLLPGTCDEQRVTCDV